MELVSCVISGIGKFRKSNQDNYYLNGVCRNMNSSSAIEMYNDKRPFVNSIYAVADGIGGESYGEKASFIAVSNLNQIDEPPTLERMQRYLQECNKDVCNFMKEHENVRGGSTFVGLSICDGIANVVNIGDSRAYLFRDGRLQQLSTDHTQVSQMVKSGLITPEYARTHPGRHQLSQYLGIYEEEMIIEPAGVQKQIQLNDMFLLCSDGLYEMAEEFRIERILGASAKVKEKTIALYELAMQLGGKDNTTVLLIELQKGR